MTDTDGTNPGAWSHDVPTPVMDAHAKRIVVLLRECGVPMTRWEIAVALEIPRRSVDSLVDGRRFPRHARRFRFAGYRGRAKLYGLADG